MASAKQIAILRKVKEAIRQPYAWPGGYPLYIVTSDGEAISVFGAREQFSHIARSTLFGHNDGWRAVGVYINWEDTELYCAHTNDKIESAYGEA